jgi:hypothetical protein
MREPSRGPSRNGARVTSGILGGAITGTGGIVTTTGATAVLATGVLTTAVLATGVLATAVLATGVLATAVLADLARADTSTGGH